MKSKIKKNLMFVLSLILLLGGGCKKSDDGLPLKMGDPAFEKYVAAYTAGTIPITSTFHIGLAAPSKKFTEGGAETEMELFSFSPDIPGKAYWINNQTLEFRPENHLKTGTKYTVRFELAEVLDTEAGFEVFEYEVRTIAASFNVRVDGLSSYEDQSMNWQYLTGRVTSSDYLENEVVEALITAKVGKESKVLTWEHDSQGTYHTFRIDSLERNKEAQTLKLTWSGTKFNIDSKGEAEVEIASLTDFKWMSANVVQKPEQHIVIKFSDPLKKGQTLKGLIRLENDDNLRYEIRGNEVKAYTSSRLTGVTMLYVEKGIKNIMGGDLTTAEKIEIEFQATEPNVRVRGSGIILPNSDALVFPFEAVNLKAVDVKIFKIYENNMQQFLQVNRLDGNYQMARVGKEILKKRINLTSETPTDYGVWNAFTLDLSDLIEAEPGALYRVELSFRQAYSLFECEEGGEPDPEDGLADSYGEYYDTYNYSRYDWNQRENPCDPSYYMYRQPISRNLLASNIGLVVKGGTNNQFLVAATDLRTTKPLGGISLELYDSQNQLMKTVTANADGITPIDLEDKPALLIAKRGKERGYLKLDDGSALSLSKFDVRGAVVQSGVKGFIYGERGVWRPGDTLFLNFMLEDRNQQLPKDHPVKFELVNPLGQTTHRMVQTKGVNGFYSFVVQTSPEAATGTWRAKVQVGGATFHKNLRIEAIKPNRLKVEIDFGKDRLAINQPEVKGKLQANWLHGAVAKELKAKVAVTLTQASTGFKGYEKYTFVDPARRFNAEEQIIFDGKVDQNGQALIPTNIKVNDVAPGMLKASFVTRVFEKSGDFSIDRFSIPYSPYETYVGVKTPKGKGWNRSLVTDSLHTLEIVTLDTDGKPVDVKDLKVKIFKVNWRWWWDAARDDFGSFIGTSYRGWTQEYTTSTVNGKGSVQFKVEYPDWGRYMVRVSDPRKGGHSAGTTIYIDWPAWQARGNRKNPGGANMLTLSADKPKYTVGEEAIVTIPAGATGRALVTVESGSQILQATWLEATGKDLAHRIPITAEMAPNVYVHTTLIQAHQHDNDLPMRLYGVVPLLVEDPATELQPVIEMPKELAPESKVNIKVGEKDGKAMTYTLAIVDDGLLDLTRFKTPQPHPVFYAREALGIKTWDLYDYVIGAYGGSLERMLSIGGDEGISAKEKDKVNRFKPMVRYIGPFELKAGDKNSHTIDIPNYVGSVRTMVIAGQDGAYGAAEKTTPVKKPLMVLATLPRVLGPQEEVKLPVTVFAMEKHIKNVKIQVQTNSLFTSGNGATQSIQFAKPGDQVINFDLGVASKIGKGEVKVIVTSGKERAEYDIEIEVRNPNPPATKYVDAVVDAGTSWESAYELIGVEGTNEAALELSNMPPIDFGRRLKYLIDYPHGCIEQTVSQAFPQLYIDDVMEVDPRVSDRASDNVKTALRKMQKYQYRDGGFSYWPGGFRSSDWGSTFAGHFMLEAESKGFGIPSGMKSKWLSYQASIARSYTGHKDSRVNYPRSSLDLAQAYRLYTLALAGKPEMGAMNRLKASNRLSNAGKWRLATAYHLAGQTGIATSIVSGLGTYVPTKGNDSYTYGSIDREKAFMLEAMTLMGRRNEAVTLMKQVSNALTSNRYLNTQATAYCLMAMSKFAGKGGTSKQMKFSYDFNGKTDRLTSTLPLKQVQLDIGKSKNGKVSIKNEGEGLMYARLILSGVPPIGAETSEERNLKMTVEYTDMQGDPIDVKRLEQGTDFMARVTVRNPNPKVFYENLALSQVFPSGWEIHNTRMDEVESVHKADKPDYQDIRDDRVYTYFHLRGRGYQGDPNLKTFTVLLNAAYLGKFYLPAVSAESMYDNHIYSRKAGQWVEVIQPGK